MSNKSEPLIFLYFFNQLINLRKLRKKEKENIFKSPHARDRQKRRLDARPFLVDCGAFLSVYYI
jgi:hypothetical protein